MASTDFVPDLEEDEPSPTPTQPSTPRWREECRDGPRPCPHVTCRYHLLVDVTPAGSLQLNTRRRPQHLTAKAGEQRAARWTRRALTVLQAAPETCALDVAERGQATYQQIASMLGLTREGVRQIEIRALEHVRDGATPLTREPARGDAPTSAPSQPMRHAKSRT